MAEISTPVAEFNFTIPEAHPNAGSITNAAIQVGALASKLAQERRTMVQNPDGRPENVSEHSHMVAMVAEALAEQFFPELDSTKVASYGVIHDIVEAYIGDTPTFDISVQGMHDKEALERLGLEQLKKEYAHLPKFAARIERYEQQEEPEARFVRMVDKLMPLLIHIYDSGSGLVSYQHNAAGIRVNARARAAEWLRTYPDMVAVIESRNELKEIVIRIVEPHFKD